LSAVALAKADLHGYTRATARVYRPTTTNYQDLAGIFGSGRRLTERT
jgi:hypothetical protein